MTWRLSCALLDISDQFDVGAAAICSDIIVMLDLQGRLYHLLKLITVVVDICTLESYWRDSGLAGQILKSNCGHFRDNKGAFQKVVHLRAFFGTTFRKLGALHIYNHIRGLFVLKLHNAAVIMRRESKKYLCDKKCPSINKHT